MDVSRASAAPLSAAPGDEGRGLDPGFEDARKKGEILLALSRALDLRETLVPGHAARTCWIAMRLADELGLRPEERDDLAFAALLKDAGGRDDTARIRFLFGDAGRDDASLHAPGPSLGRRVADAFDALRHNDEDRAWNARLTEAAGLLRREDVRREAAKERCARGTEIARTLGLDRWASAAIRDLDEHWDGSGVPHRRRGAAISRTARVLSLAQTLELWTTAFGIPVAYRMLYRRKGRWFDPEVVQACEALRTDAAFWEGHAGRVVSGSPATPIAAGAYGEMETDDDAVCRALTLIEEAKSSATGAHSSRVTQYALEMGEAFGFPAERLETLRRAALLHDIGKLGVSNAILDKPEGLTDGEFSRVKLHPRFTWEILSTMRSFRRIAEIASAHHERLDGTGYWQGLAAGRLDLDMRILAVADVFDALSADRPYRDAMPMAKVFATLESESRRGLDPICVAILRDLHYRAGPKTSAAASLPKILPVEIPLVQILPVQILLAEDLLANDLMAKVLPLAA